MTLRRTAPRRSRRRAVAGAMFLVAALGAVLGPAATVTGGTGDIGFEGASFTGAGTAPTGEKPESKLWWNDGSWWGVLYASGSFRIHRLDRSVNAWIDTGVVVDTRPSSRADALWDGTRLYVASHVRSTSPATGYPSRLSRYSYQPATRTYSLDPGFPVQINNERSETLVISKDSTGVLWATWVRGGRVYVSHTVGSDATWSAPSTPAVKGSTTLSSDDISSVVAFGPGKIGVMWSNQRDSAMYFAVHVDGQPDDQWDGSRTAIQGPNEADDHINLKSLQADGSGRVYAAVKSSQDAAAAPLVRLLVRSTAGDWASHTFGRVRDHHTRPIVLLDEEHGVIHMFATSGESGGTIYEKTSPLDAISFATGLGTPVIRDASSADMNNVTSTKQNLGSQTGLVILASNDTTARYWHADLPLEPPGPTPSPTPTPTPSPTPTPTPSPTPTPTPGGTLSFPAVADAKTNTSNPTGNYGAQTALQVRDGSTDGLPTYRSYLKFDAQGLAGPPSALVLRLRVTDATANTIRVLATSSSWSEATITAANAPAPGTLLATKAGPIPLGTLDIALPASAVAGDGTVSFVLENGGTDSALFSSREGAAPPVLLVTPQ